MSLLEISKDLARLLEVARSGEDEFLRIEGPQLFPILNQVKEKISDNTLPFFSYKETDLFMSLAGLMEVCSADSKLGRLILEIVSRIVISFDPLIPVMYHFTLCDMLWGVLESDDIDNGLLASRIFVELYKESGSVMMDAEVSTRLHKFVVWLRQM